jgi:hypothetical protein
MYASPGLLHISGMAIDDRGVVVEYWLAGQNGSNSEKCPIQCHLAEHECDAELPAAEPQVLRWESRV